MATSPAQKTILDILLEQNRLTPTEVVNFDKNLKNSEIERKLRNSKIVSSEDIAKAYAILYDLPLIRLENYNVTPDAFELISREMIEKYNIIAFEKEGNIPGGKVKIAVGSPGELSNNPEVINQFKEKKGVSAEIYITTLEDITNVLNRFKDNSHFDTPVEVKKLDHPVNHNQNFHLQSVDLKNLQISYDVISKFPIDISKKHKMIVFDNPSASLIRVAVADPSDPKTQEILDFVRQKNEIAIETFVAPPDEIMWAIDLFYRKPATPPDVPSTPPMKPIKLETSKEPNEKKPNVFDRFFDRPVNSIDTKEKAKPPVPVQPPAPVSKISAPPAEHLKDQAKPQFVLRTNEPAKPVATNTTANAGAAPPGSMTAMDSSEKNLDKFLGKEVNDTETLKQICASGNVPQILAATVSLAAAKKASDIHIEPEEKDLRVRFRVDGILRDVIKMPLELQPAIISRIKILSKLKIDEQRVPQDGRFDVVTRSHEIDLRVSTLPTVRGEKAALRILDKTQNIFGLQDLGIDGHNLKILEENITKPFGVILSTGPTGSGKSTTLYSILQKVSNPSINVITLEDPVEYEMPGINQCQVKPKIGFSFADGLRSVLRQDPNIIMVGEIRDAETAGMATHAALTGHLVLTTLHTNDAAGALPRLINMGIEPFLITSSINVIMAQRLVRKICSNCKRESKIPPPIIAEIEKDLAKFNLPKPFKFFEGAGCPKCNQGYSGRIGIYEVLPMTEQIEEIAIKRRPASEIAVEAEKEGMITLKQDGLMKAIKGITTVSEVLRVTTTER